MNQLASIIHIINAIYLWLIGLGIGALVISGAIVAPVIFSAYSFLPDLSITQYESGILMTQIFIKLNVLLNSLAIVIIIYELLAFKSSFKPSVFLLVVNALSVVLIFVFTLYYTPHILEAQNMGAAYTATPEFESMHTQSEFLFKLLLATLSISFLYRITLLSRKPTQQASKSTPKTSRKKSS
ncbi:hypothetical protein BKH46_01010 [Helicobacter sp. 12S02634-8]|uniref:DUF4149 domain-containing protein n=1 Tax=Helicobacter sp. 12S02634-8 TaxID=1476199 RepID=UPI000BA7BA51|nr:DUF4149 domain-containing protein [Helicobacter sp. 12S02634-8]PAF48516.1 hypothetical protein BKH46_01010 [Helicobacter sp. 12S02634-8]